MTNHKYSKKEIEFLKNNVKGITLKELTTKFNNKFKLNISERAIANQKNKYGLKSGIVGGQFRKGNIPINKGTKGMFNAGGNKTSFKKGNKPSNWLPLGTERYGKDGYIEVKVQDGNLQKNWKGKHRVLWEKENGKIPNGYALIFADGNKLNIKLDNLILVSRAELLILNRQELIKDDPDLTKTGTLIAKVMSKANKLKKRVV